jgi:hypothetical protein
MLPKKRTQLLEEMQALAELAVQGSLAELMMRCGKRNCACSSDPARRHGPALYLKFRKPGGGRGSLYIPRRHEAQARRAVEAWARMWEIMLELGCQNRDALRKQVQASR